jgi:hypothetical protein
MICGSRYAFIVSPSFFQWILIVRDAVLVDVLNNVVLYYVVVVIVGGKFWVIEEK